MMNEEPRKWVCWEIDHTGDRDHRVVVNSLHLIRTAKEAAEAAAAELDEKETRRKAYECPACTSDRRRWVIEVEDEPEPQRFLVSCRVRLEYEALAVKEKQKP